MWTGRSRKSRCSSGVIRSDSGSGSSGKGGSRIVVVVAVVAVKVEVVVVEGVISGVNPSLSRVVRTSK